MSFPHYASWGSLSFKKIKLSIILRFQLGKSCTQRYCHSLLHIKVSKFSPAEYLYSKKLSREEKRTLFKLRFATINVKGNMSSSFKDKMWCRTSFLFPESQEHIFYCSDLRIKLKYEMIHGNLQNQESFTKVYHLLLQARTDILNT